MRARGNQNPRASISVSTRRGWGPAASGKKWAALLGLLLLPGADRSRAQNADHWVGTWTTAVVARTQPLTFNNQTLRQIVHVSAGGTRAHVMFSNVYGTAPLRIGAAHLALR